MIPNSRSDKLRGGYYTPNPIAEFLAKWAVQTPHSATLEPSCGDGVILETTARVLRSHGASNQQIAQLIQGVEVDPLEADKARQRLEALGIVLPRESIHTGDFFALCQIMLASPKRFDAIVGNPPFIRYQNFLDEYRSAALGIMRQASLNPNKLTNSWVPFVVASTLLLTDSGRLAMVVPAELFQVKYAAEVRQFLSDSFHQLTIITFKSLVFAGIQQEVVLLLGDKNVRGKGGIRVIELTDLATLNRYIHDDFAASELKPIDHSKDKWTQYFLHEDEILLLRSLRSDDRLTTCGDVMSVDVGVVTGQNKFFVLNNSQVTEQGLEQFILPIVGRSSHLRGVAFTDDDLAANREIGHQSSLFYPPNVSIEELPHSARSHIAAGELEGYHQGYKCSIRKRWYIVPSIWVPDAFLLRQVHGYPKLILNRTDATCTDTIHRVKFRSGVSPEQVTASFLNSLTLAFSEITGRSYGGGVLTFEPSESERLPLPLVASSSLDLAHIDRLVREGRVEDVLELTDKTLLVKGIGLSEHETKMLRAIWVKLRDRRIRRKSSANYD